MYFLSFVPGNVNACVDILSAGWQSMLPEDWWKTGRISITPYDNTQAYPIFGGKAYTQRNGNSFDIVPVAYIKTISAKKIADACSRACKEENPYCTIVFDFIGYN